MKILLWHGWLLEGAGSNVYTARVAEEFRRRGHDVALICQETHPERYGFLDAWGVVGRNGVRIEESRRESDAEGRAVLLRPDIGALLPVFVYDEYETFEVKRFVDLTDEELEHYLSRNVDALRAVAQWHGTEAAVAGHAVPGPVIAHRALGPGRYVAKVHGSDLEYAVRVQERYRDLMREGLQGARAVAGATRDVLARTVELVGETAPTVVVAPGVDVERFRRLENVEIDEVLARLDVDPDASRGRPASFDERVRDALERRDPSTLDRLAAQYDQTAPDPDAATKIRAARAHEGPTVAYLGKLIPQKGVHLLLAALAGLPDLGALVVGPGTFREWLHALVVALDEGDEGALAWLQGTAGTDLELSGAPAARLLAGRVWFTGRLDHRYAPAALSVSEVLVVPSVLDEAFGMVAAEGAAAGALPLVAGHSGLAEVAETLETATSRPGLFSFEPGPGAVERLADGLKRLLRMPGREREELRARVVETVRGEWTWDRTADRLLAIMTN
jgi:glycosyltransferase involved in cell wall biosynthesis